MVCPGAHEMAFRGGKRAYKTIRRRFIRLSRTPLSPSWNAPPWNWNSTQRWCLAHTGGIDIYIRFADNNFFRSQLSISETKGTMKWELPLCITSFPWHLRTRNTCVRTIYQLHRRTVSDNGTVFHESSLSQAISLTEWLWTCSVSNVWISLKFVKNYMVWVRERTTPTEWPPLVGEVIANFFADRGCHVASVTDLYSRIVGFLDRNRYFSIK
jgi:hypothetical protein